MGDMYLYKVSSLSKNPVAKPLYNILQSNYHIVISLYFSSDNRCQLLGRFKDNHEGIFVSCATNLLQLNR